MSCIAQFTDYYNGLLLILIVTKQSISLDQDMLMLAHESTISSLTSSMC